MDLIAAQQIVVKVPESSGGASIESVLVFIGGVLAAIAAVAASLLAAKGAAKRLEKSLDAERQRFDRQLDAESQKTEKQFSHERYIARRLEASTTIEQIARSVSRNSTRVTGLVLKLLSGRDLSEEQLIAFDHGLDELREEFSILAIRFGEESDAVQGLGNYLKAVSEVLPPVKDMPLNEAEKEKLKESMKNMNAADINFLMAARSSLDAF